MVGSPYASYLRLADLLDLQQPRSVGQTQEIHQSEHFFIVVHQAAELLLRQALGDLRALMRIREGERPDWGGVERLLSRTESIVHLLCELTSTLDHLPQEHFLAFRGELGNASAGQSQQFADLFELVGTRSEGTIARALRDNADTPEGVAKRLEGLRSEVRRWQWGHVALVQRMIANTPGSGGSAGVAWLRSRIGNDRCVGGGDGR